MAGTLGQGGAERQLLYMARALHQWGVDVRVYCLYRGEYYEAALQSEHIPVISPSPGSNRGTRLVRLAKFLYAFKPHVIQAAHFYLNLPVNILGRLFGAIAISSSRSDIEVEIKGCRPWGIWGVRTARMLVANSQASIEGLTRLGVGRERTSLLSNVIRLETFDPSERKPSRGLSGSESIIVAAIGTLLENKRFEHFLRAMASARKQEPRLTGILVGDGPERRRLQTLADSWGLQEPIFRFLGSRDDVPELLRQASVFVLCSKTEGCPNVVLEAMAARLPVITTPAGDAARIIQAAQAGFVVDHGDDEAIAQRLVELANDPELGTQLGNNGRRYVERFHNASMLAETLLRTYHRAAVLQKRRRASEFLNAYSAAKDRSAWSVDKR